MAPPWLGDARADSGPRRSVGDGRGGHRGALLRCAEMDGDVRGRGARNHRREYSVLTATIPSPPPPWMYGLAVFNVLTSTGLAGRHRPAQR